jgi:signal transduction histidine kinase
MLSGLTALVAASIAFLLYDARTFRERMADRLSTEAEIIGFNCVSPILFNDANAASQTLQGLRAERAVVAAVVFGKQGAAPFAAYAADGAEPLLPPSRPAENGPRHAFDARHLVVSQPIEFESKRIGTLVLRADLAELRSRQRHYAAIVAAVLCLSLVLALGISWIAERSISTPILQLAQTARRVSTAKDYTVRAVTDGRNDEIGELTRTFNEMLDRIQGQNRDLEEAREDLERRVDGRTRELAAANKELEAFSYSVSHDLRAPLRAIDGFSKVLLGSYGQHLDDRGRHYLERVRAGTQRMAQLIDDMLALSRLSRQDLQRQEINVSEIAGGVASELARRAPDRQVTLNIQDGLVASADPHLVTILLENLVGNAWKFTSKKADGCIQVDAEVHDRERVFYVRDNGAGFDMAYADKLFGAFQRLHDDSDFEGTGIGLATVARIVHRHGGRVWAEGAVGKGATFYFTLEQSA